MGITDYYAQPNTASGSFHNSPESGKSCQAFSRDIVEVSRSGEDHLIDLTASPQNDDQTITYIPDNEPFSIQSILGPRQSPPQGPPVDIHQSFNKRDCINTFSTPPVPVAVVTTQLNSKQLQRTAPPARNELSFKASVSGSGKSLATSPPDAYHRAYSRAYQAELTSSADRIRARQAGRAAGRAAGNVERERVKKLSSSDSGQFLNITPRQAYLNAYHNAYREAYKNTYWFEIASSGDEDKAEQAGKTAARAAGKTAGKAAAKRVSESAASGPGESLPITSEDTDRRHYQITYERAYRAAYQRAYRAEMASLCDKNKARQAGRAAGKAASKTARERMKESSVFGFYLPDSSALLVPLRSAAVHQNEI